MAIKKFKNKAVKKFENKEGGKRYFFPKYGKTVFASSLKEAKEIIKKIK